MAPNTTTRMAFDTVPITEGFRLDATCIFLTYPQCDTDIQELMLHLKTVVKHQIEYIVVSSELHQDGAYHRHALIKWSRKVAKKNATRLFDYNGFHPNQQKTRNIEAAVE